MGKILYKTRLIVGCVSAASVVGMVIILALILRGRIGLFINEILLVSLLIGTIPSTILEFINQRWLGSIEDQMPILVRGIAEFQETGISVEDAFVSIVENKLVHGPLAAEVKKINVQLSWGLSLDEALQQFSDRVQSPIVNRFCALVLEASRSGGVIKNVFTSTSGFMQEIREMDKEISSQMRPYVIIIYAAFFVFMFTSIILVKSFFEPLQGTQMMLGSGSLPDVGEYKDFFYRTMILSGFMSGLMAGKISSFRVLGGLKHSIALMAIGYILFFTLIPPNWVVA